MKHTFFFLGNFDNTNTKVDGAASIDTRLELAGVIGPVCRARSMYNLHKKGGPAGGVLAASPIVKSVSFEEKNRDQLLMVL